MRDGRVYVGDTDGKFFCFDAASGAVLWGREANAQIDSAPNFYKDVVLFGSQDATLYVLDAKTGQDVWKHAIADQIRCSPTVVEGRAFIAGCDGKLHVIELDRGQEIGAVGIESPTGATPAVQGQRVFFGTEGGTFFAVDWRRTENRLEGQVRARPVVSLVGRSDQGVGHRRRPRQTGACLQSGRRFDCLEFCHAGPGRFVPSGGR